MSSKRSVYGFDGNGISVGDRVELHPATDLWMRGARYGTVTKIGKDGRVSADMDKLGRLVTGPASSFRRLDMES